MAQTAKATVAAENEDGAAFYNKDADKNCVADLGDFEALESTIKDPFAFQQLVWGNIAEGRVAKIEFYGRNAAGIPSQFAIRVWCPVELEDDKNLDSVEQAIKLVWPSVFAAKSLWFWFPAAFGASKPRSDSGACFFFACFLSLYIF